MISFAHPWVFWLLAIVPVMGVWYLYRGRVGLTVSTVDTFPNIRTAKYWLRHVPFALLCGGVVFIVIALARPQVAENGSSSTTHGIDIVLALDISGSMLARDFNPDRIAAAKDVAAEFINDRPSDRIGLVVFAGESFTQSPLTTDRATLLNLLARVETGVVDDGTAIGSGLATAINRLKDSPAKSKVVILLTDGENNTGRVAPMTAAEIAQTLGIKVYTIGVGTRGEAPYPMRDAWGGTVMVTMPVEIDEEILTDIASLTGGEYFRATDRRSLAAIYEQINRLETSEVEVNEYTRKNEVYGRFLLWGLILSIIGFCVKYLFLRPLV